MKSHRIFQIVCLFLIFSTLSLGGTYSGGSGDPNAPYLIADANDWQELMTTSGDWSADFELTADIDLTDANNLTPVGNTTAKFTGVFDGNDFTISNVAIESSGAYVGLFGYANNGAEIYNLDVENVNIIGTYYVGGLVGNIDSCTISNCSVTGTVEGSGSCAGILAGAAVYSTLSDCSATGNVTNREVGGGLVGFTNFSMISNCSATGDVSNRQYAGGLVGMANNSTISDCYATGDVDNDYDSGAYAGGLVGTANNSTISDCSATGNIVNNNSAGGLIGGAFDSTVSKCYATGNVENPNMIAGGLLGGMGSDCLISECYATGNVKTDIYAGGLVGYYEDFDSTVRDCYATGNVEANGYVGGLIGRFENATVSNCYATGYVDCNYGGGGFAGDIYYSTVSNCFWDTQTSGKTVGVDGGSSSGITGLTTAQMQTEINFTNAGWDFVRETTNGTDEIWIMNGYPHLVWEYDDIGYSFTWYVDASVTSSGDGRSWDTAFKFLQEALDTADDLSLSGDEIWVAAGTYYPDEGQGHVNDNRNESFELVSCVELYGGFDPNNGDDTWAERDYVNNEVILSGNIKNMSIATDNSYHVVTCSETTDVGTVIDGFTIVDGYANGSWPGNHGAGMYLTAYYCPDIDNCVISDNYAESGAGIYLDAYYNYSSNITNCIITNNMATRSGGGLLSFGGSPNLSYCVISGNEADSGYGSGDGAGMYYWGGYGDSKISHCIFEDNVSGGSGGALELGIFMVNQVFELEISDCIFADNSADSVGGAIFDGAAYNVPGDLTYTNCIFTGNTADTSGGAIYNYASSPAIINCTFVDNSCTWYYSAKGGAIYNRYSSIQNQGSADPVITNCIFWGNTADTAGAEIYNDSNCEAIVQYCNIEGGLNGSKCGGVDSIDGGGNINADPVFVDETNPIGDDDEWATIDDGLILNVGGPCIDAAHGDYALETDILGNSRCDDPFTTDTGVGDPNYVDMGAYEFQYSPAVYYVDNSATGADDGSSWTDAFDDLQEALAVVSAGDEIWVAAGTYFPDGSDSGNRDLSFELVENVAVYGGFNGTETGRGQRNWDTNVTTLSGNIGASNYSKRIVKGNDGAIIDGFYIERAYCDANPKCGGGLYQWLTNAQVIPTKVSNCTFRWLTSTGSGGAIGIQGGTASQVMEIDNCEFNSNKALSYGGAMYLSGLTYEINDCIFNSNTTYNSATAWEKGGAAFLDGGDGNQIINCVFNSNGCPGHYDYRYGGAIYLTGGGDNDIVNCVFANNYALYGGALQTNAGSYGTIYVTNCTFYENYARSHKNVGFVIYPPKGAAIYHRGSSTSKVPKELYMLNCIFWDKLEGDTDWGYATSEFQYDCYPLNYGSNRCYQKTYTNPPAAPGFCDTSLELDAGSPCIDAGYGTDAPLLDILGNSRYDDPNTTNTGTGDPNYVDIGAYEYQG